VPDPADRCRQTGRDGEAGAIAAVGAEGGFSDDWRARNLLVEPVDRRKIVRVLDRRQWITVGIGERGLRVFHPRKGVQRQSFARAPALVQPDGRRHHGIGQRRDSDRHDQRRACPRPERRPRDGTLRTGLWRINGGRDQRLPYRIACERRSRDTEEIPDLVIELEDCVHPIPLGAGKIVNQVHQFQ